MLLTAVFIISSLFWLIKNVNEKKEKFFFNFSKKYFLFQLLLIIIFTQIILGAFVSGLDAGKIYQTWPMMGEYFFPNDLIIRNVTDLIELNNHSLVQFYHRIFAYLIIVYTFFLTFIIYKKDLKHLYKPINIMLGIVSLQIILGIFTLISGLNIFLASAHQITGVILVFSALNLYYLNVN